jgi:hypothetical protein
MAISFLNFAEVPYTLKVPYRDLVQGQSNTMESCRNVLLEFVYEEANAQIQGLGSGIRHKYNLDEVIAYTLNRLPPKFASTDVDLQLMRQQCSDMRADINKVVRQALLGVRRDPLRQPEPLENIELANAPHALFQVQNILGWKSLMWSDLPKALEEALELAIAKYNSGNVALHRRGTLERNRFSTKMSLRKSVQKSQPPTESKRRDYEVYMLESRHLAHSLERLVIRMAQNRAELFPKNELRFIRLEDVLAKSLNRLPSLYATSSKGLGYLRHYAQMNIGSEVSIIVHEAMLQTRQQNLQRCDQLIFYKVRHEREQALLKVGRLLNREVKWQNLVEVVLKSLELAKSGKVCWQRECTTSQN